jgi:hypothetical protein
MSKPLRVAALVLAALALTVTSAHVLELPAKMQYAPSLYAAVNGTLYRWFAIVGGIYAVAAIVAAWALAWAARSNEAAFRWAFVGAMLPTLAFIAWLALVMPVDTAVSLAAEEAPERVPALWSHLRARWEYGHLTGFVFQLLGFVALAMAAVADAPPIASRVRASTSVLVRAPRDTVFALYAKWAAWPRLFPEIDVDQVDGPVPNRMTVVSPEVIVLEEHKRHYDARFENRFERGVDGTRYIVTADVTLLGKLRWLRLLAKPFIRSRIRRFVLEPIRQAAEAT